MRVRAGDHRGRRSVVRAVLATAVLVGIGCAGPSRVPPDSDRPSNETYVIGATDQLLVSVWKVPELTVNIPVRPDGKISMPLIDDVRAEGLTPEELKEVLAEALSEYISAPDVTVVVTDTNSYAASVVGEGIVRRGVVQLRRDTTIVEVLATMGGFTPFAQSDSIRVIRKTPEGVKEYRFNYDRYVAGKEKDSNFLVRPGDIIVVPD